MGSDITLDISLLDFDNRTEPKTKITEPNEKNFLYNLTYFKLLESENQIGTEPRTECRRLAMVMNFKMVYVDCLVMFGNDLERCL